MNANPSNELEEESICQDAVQNFEGRGPGPGSEHWLLEESNNFFDAEDGCDQLQHHTQEAQEPQENFYQELQQEELEDPKDFNATEWDQEHWQEAERHWNDQCVQHSDASAQQDTDTSQDQDGHSTRRCERAEEQCDCWDEFQDC